jgi:hypothetical protein
MSLIDRVDPLGVFPWYLFALPGSADAYRKSCIHLFTFIFVVSVAVTLVGVLVLFSAPARSYYTSSLTPLGSQFLVAAFLLVPSLVALIRTRISQHLDIFGLALVVSLPVIAALMPSIDLLLFDQPGPRFLVALKVGGAIFSCAVFWLGIASGNKQ